MQKALLIYNPYSGDRSILHQLDYILKKAQENQVILFPYRIDKNSNQFLTTLKLNQFDFVILSGGDGTLHTIINFFLKNNYQIPIGIIPAGTCNDFASSLQIPTSLEDCLKVILRVKLGRWIWVYSMMNIIF